MHDSFLSLAHEGKISAKACWRAFRQFADPHELQSEFNCEFQTLWTVAETTDDNLAHKLLLVNASGQRCESVVLFPSPRRDGSAERNGNKRRLSRATACISSQPGCGVGCPFCSTGELGYRGNLTEFEIVEQVYWCGLVARQRQRRLRNVVFMGMGEPLHNAPAIHAAIGMLLEPKLFGLAPRHITVSTAGVPTAMVELATAFPGIRIALSLHSADPEQRKTLVPRATGDLDLLRSTIRQINDIQTDQSVWLEVVLFDSLNNSLREAELLREFCQGLKVEVNLIPYNMAANSDRYSPADRASREAFACHLRQAGIRTTIRTSFGSNTTAACGQLNAKDLQTTVGQLPSNHKP